MKGGKALGKNRNRKIATVLKVLGVRTVAIFYRGFNQET